MDIFLFYTLGILILSLVAYRLWIPERYRGVFFAILSIYGIFQQNTGNWLINLSFIFLTLGFIILSWIFGYLIAKTKHTEGTFLLPFAIGILLIPFFGFKAMLSFSPVPFIAKVFSLLSSHGSNIFMPLGLSYFTLRGISYLIEIKRGTIRPQKFLAYTLYIIFWPTLFSGPIERPKPFFDQAVKNAYPTEEDTVIGFSRIVTGCVKKLGLSSVFFSIASPYLSLQANSEAIDLSGWSSWQLWICITAYYLYLYFDFSGYSDIAIGVARMFGYRICENFQWPIFAVNPNDFWKRWHMSFVSWIRDYVYAPLGGSDAGYVVTSANILMMMFLIGIWHGLAGHFALWGIYHAIWMILFVLLQKKWPSFGVPTSCFGKFIWWVITFQIVNMGWVLFLFDSSSSLAIYFKLIGIG